MKKIKYILIIFVLLLTACKNYSFDLDKFIDKATFNGYLIENNKTGYETYPNILDVYYAVNRENAYDIQFLKLNGIDYAKTNGDSKRAISLIHIFNIIIEKLFFILFIFSQRNNHRKD